MKSAVATVFIALMALVSVDLDLAVAQSSSSAVTRLSLAGPAKRYCSGIWVSNRNRREALYNSVLLDDALVEDYETWPFVSTIGDRLSLQLVTASQRAPVTSVTRDV